MVNQATLKIVSQLLPGNVRAWAKNIYYKDRHWAHPSLKQFGTVPDLYYWVADGNLDTLLMLQNYFSALYPDLPTKTEGLVNLYNRDGRFLGKKSFSLNHCGGAKIRVSDLLDELGLSLDNPYGTLEVNIAIPSGVLNQIKTQKSVYFWDRFYIGYTTALGQTCFVHGVDKTHIYRDGVTEPIGHWHQNPKSYEWSPEIPVNINDYAKFSVILINRTGHGATTSLSLSDNNDQSISWSEAIPSNGVRRFELSSHDVGSLDPTEIRMRIKGMPTQFGRPVVFKEFVNGAISAMHC